MEKKKNNGNENWQNQIDRKQQKEKEHFEARSVCSIFVFIIVFAICANEERINESTNNENRTNEKNEICRNCIWRGGHGQEQEQIAHNNSQSKQFEKYSKFKSKIFSTMQMMKKDETRIQNTMKHKHSTSASQKPGYWYCCCLYLFVLFSFCVFVFCLKCMHIYQYCCWCSIRNSAICE